MTRLESPFLVTRTRLDSSHVFHRMTRLESQSITRDSSQSHFYKSSEFPMCKPCLFAHKEISIFCFRDGQDWWNFLFCMSSSVERIEDFCDPNPVQYFQCVIQSDPNPVTLSRYLMQSSLYPKKNSD